MKQTIAIVGALGWIVVVVILLVVSAADGPATRTAYDSTRDVVTRLQLRPGETLRLAQPIGAFDVTCSAEGHP